MLQADVDELVIVMLICGCWREVYEDLSVSGFSVMSEAVQVPAAAEPDAEAPAVADAVGEAEAVAAAVGAAEAADEGAATVGTAAGAAAAVEVLGLGVAVAPAPAPGRVAMSVMTTMTSRSTATTPARRRQYTLGDCGPMGLRNDDMRVG